MEPSNSFDVVIVGGGMAGLAQALALAPGGLRIALLDRQPAPPPAGEFAGRCGREAFADRVSALTPASVQLLRELGVWDKLAALRTCPYRFMEVWDADGNGSIRFSADELHVPELGHIVENDLVTCVLAEAAAQMPNLSLFHQRGLGAVERRDSAWSLTLKGGEKLSCSLLIGADGGNSLVRELCGFNIRRWSYKQQALVCSVRTREPHRHTAYQRFMSGGPLAFLPLSPVAGGGTRDSDAQHCCSIVWSCDEALAAELKSLPEAEFARRLELGLESRLGEVELLSAPRSFPLRQCHATDYAGDGVALVGDAAHTIHPLAGQGVNLGLADVASLSRVIQLALTQNRDFSSFRTLSRYQRERKPENLAMMLSMEGFKRVFGSDALPLRYLRNRGLDLADRLSPLKHQLMKLAMGLNA